MINLSLIRNILNGITNKGMLISYEKMRSKPEVSVGYVDITAVVDRYKKSADGATIKSLAKQTPVVESNYFLKRYFLSNKLKGGKILDVGCGNGLYSIVFSDINHPFKNLSYHGSEIDDKIVNLCQEINPNGIFIKSNADKIDSKDKNFEVVHCSSTLHYTLDNWKKAIGEMSRISNNYVVITRHPVTKYHKNFYVHQTVKTVSNVENHYFIVINRDELEAEFLKKGLKIVSRDYSQEEYRVKGVDEKIILVQYILKK